MNLENPVILCVDDEDVNLRLLETILVRNGFDVVCATSGTDALLKIKSQPIDLVISDVTMPGMDGINLCRKVKEDPRHSDIPIIMVTGLASHEDRVRGIEVGVEDYFTKPFNKTALIARIKILLKVKKLSDERNKVQAALRESEEKYRLINENMADLITVTDMNLRFTYISPSIMRTHGFTVEEAMNLTLDQFLTPGSQQVMMTVFEEEMKSEAAGKADPGRISILEVEEYKKDGSIIWLECSISAQRDKEHKPIGILAVSRDITARKRAEEALQKAHDNLESLVKLRTAELARANDVLQSDIGERKLAEEKLQNITDSLRNAVSMTIQVLVSAIEVRDPYTAGHQRRAANLARAIAAEMGLPPEMIEGIRMAGYIHDIGKLSIPAEILSKPTKLTAIEFALIKEHAQSGYEILKDVQSPWPLAEMVYQHHERKDGSGYPRKLKENEIIIEARILAVADVIEAMASHRPYRASLGIDPALAEIEKNRGIFYDEAVVDACIRVFREKGFQLESA